MIDEFDHILHHPERHTYAPGEIMVNTGDSAPTQIHIFNNCLLALA